MDEYQIVELTKDRYRTGSIKAGYNFLLNDRTIISEKSYERSYRHNPSISKQVTGYVFRHRTRFISNLEFPSLQWYNIPYAYLYKIGYVIRGYSPFSPAPLPNLKYIIYCFTSDTEHMSSMEYEFQDKLVIELVDVDVAANNINLPKIVSSVLGAKLLSGIYQINERTRSQKLFAGHTWKDADDIVFRYFDKNERHL